tara:strand:- start:7675 stop:11214 length:3540 start_codon:yes stop_codon:yes gene_type:complete
MKLGGATHTLILDGELLQEDPIYQTRVKIFDVMYLNKNVEMQPFISRLNLISDYFQQIQPQSFVDKLVDISSPYKMSEIPKLLNQDGNLVESIDGFTIDGLVLMKNVPYFRGSFDSCLKFKNTKLQTVDLSIMEKMSYQNDQVHLVLGVMDKSSLTKWAETTVLNTCIIPQGHFNLNVGNIVEFCYGHAAGGAHKLVPYRNRSDKRYPNSKVTADNVKAACVQPITAKELLTYGQHTTTFKDIPLQKLQNLPQIAEIFVPMKYVTPSRVIKPGHLSYKAAKILNSDGYTLTVVGSQYISSIDSNTQHLVNHEKKNTNQILATFDCQNQSIHKGLVESIQSDDVLSIPKECIELLGEESYNKFSCILNIYLDNLEIYQPNELEIEFKFGIQYPDSGYINGITESFYNKVKKQLLKDFAPEQVFFTKQVDHIQNNQGSNLRETFNYDENGALQSMGTIHKKKIFIESAGKYFQEFLSGQKNPFVIRCTVSQEKMNNTSNSCKLNWDVKREKERISFTSINYKVDLTKVKSFLKDSVKPTSHFELEIELTTLQVESFEWIFDPYSELNVQWVSDIFSIINSILNLATPLDVDEPVKSIRASLNTHGSGILKKYTHQIKSLIYNGSFHFSNSTKENLSKISTRYFNEIFHTSPNVFKGKSIHAIMCAIIYVSLQDSGVLLKIQDFLKESICNGVDQREFYNAFVIVNKHTQRVQQFELWTLHNYIEIITMGASLKDINYNETEQLFNEIQVYFDDIYLINQGCNKLVIICLYIHVKYSIHLHNLFAIIKWTPSKNFPVLKCIGHLKLLLKNNEPQVIAHDHFGQPEFIIDKLQLTMISVSSSRFTFKAAPTTTYKQSESIRTKLKQLSDPQKDLIFTCCCFIDNNNPNENCIVTQLLQQSKKFWISQCMGDQQVPLFGDNWVDMLLFFDVFDIINLSELFNHFECTEQWIFIRNQESMTKSFNNDQKWNKPIASRKRKRINYSTFQNSIQLLYCHDTHRYDIKIFANGKYNISGCTTTLHAEISVISQQLIYKINSTKYAVKMSTFATKIYPIFEKLPSYFNDVKITLLNGVAKSNLRLKPTSTNQFGLKDIKDIMQSEYKNLLVKNNNPNLKPNQVPLLLPPPELRQGRRLLIKLTPDPHNDIVTVQLHTTGTMVFSSSTKQSMISVYNIMGKILYNYQNSD